MLKIRILSLNNLSLSLSQIHTCCKDVKNGIFFIQFRSGIIAHFS